MLPRYSSCQTVPGQIIQLISEMRDTQGVGVGMNKNRLSLQSPEKGRRPEDSWGSLSRSPPALNESKCGQNSSQYLRGDKGLQGMAGLLFDWLVVN